MEPRIRIANHDYKPGVVRAHIVLSKAVKKVRAMKLDPDQFEAFQATILEGNWERVDKISHLEGEQFLAALKKIIKNTGNIKI